MLRLRHYVYVTGRDLFYVCIMSVATPAKCCAIMSYDVMQDICDGYEYS